MAFDFIKNLGYKVIERNHRQKWGEIDIVALAPNKTLVFFEVKTLRYLPHGPVDGQLTSEMQLTSSKLRKLQKTAILYANSNSHLVDDNRGWRIDLLAIDINKETLSSNIRHYENI